MPLALRHRRVGTGEAHGELGCGGPTCSRPSGPSATHSSPSRIARDRERRQVGSRARLAEQLAPPLLVAHHAAGGTGGAAPRCRARTAPARRCSDPRGLSRPRLYGASTDSATRACSGARSRPPYSTGHVATARPDSAKVGYHASYSARLRTARIAARPPGAASRQLRGTFSSTHASTAAWTSSSEDARVTGRRVDMLEATPDRSGPVPPCGRIPWRRMLCTGANYFVRDGRARAHRDGRDHRRGGRRLRQRIGVARPHSAAAPLPLPERGRVPPRGRGLRRRQPAVVRPVVRARRPGGADRSRRRTSSAATRSSARTRSPGSRADSGADEGRPARRRPRLLLGVVPRVVEPAASRHPGHAAQRARRRARQGERVRRARGARVVRRGVRGGRRSGALGPVPADDPHRAREGASSAGATTTSRSVPYTDDEIAAIDDAVAGERDRRRGRRTPMVGGRRGGRRARTAREGPAARHRHGRLARGHRHGPLRREGAPARVRPTPAHAPVLQARRRSTSPTCSSASTGTPSGPGRPATRRCYDYGRMRETWLIHLCTDWMGDDAWLWKLDCQFRKFNYVGDTHWMRGRVTRKYLADGDRPRRRPRDLGREPTRRHHHARATPPSCCPHGSTGRSCLPEPPGGATTCQETLDALAERFAAEESR